jgi:hypothetical protein
LNKLGGWEEYAITQLRWLEVVKNELREPRVNVERQNANKVEVWTSVAKEVEVLRGAYKQGVSSEEIESM